MNKFKYFILIIVALVSFLSPVFEIQAEADPLKYEFLAPLPNPNGTIEPVFTVNDSSFTTYLNMLIKLTIGVAGVLTVIMIVMGGIQYMGSELISNKEQGKSQITNALLGLFITLGAYALLYTINPELLKSDPSKSMTEVIVDIQDNTPQTPGPGGRYSDGRINGTIIPFMGIKQLPSFATLNKAQCAKVSEPNCTSTYLLNIDKLSTIHDGCNCNFTITGGTETWLHGPNTTHLMNSGTVDLRPTNELNKYFTDNFKSGGLEVGKWYDTPAGHALYEYDPVKDVYHWHFNPTDRK